MERVYGVVTALVTDVKDPDDMGRIKLSYPWLAADGTDSGWAPIVRPMAGNDRGFDYLPEVDDEALVAFEHGMVDHPMVLGFLHNGKDLPPHTGIDEHVRRLKSVSGHVFELDDRSGKESIRLHTPKGHQLELHDPNAAIELHTAGGHKVRLPGLAGPDRAGHQRRHQGDPRRHPEPGRADHHGRRDDHDLRHRRRLGGRPAPPTCP